MRLAYRSALVTGASSGIGAEIARELARRGAALVLVARREDRLSALADELSNATAVEVLAAELSNATAVEVLAADLATDAGVAAVEQRLRDPDRPVELLVNNAGVGTGGAFHELPAGEESQLVRVNVVALHRLTHAAVGSMVAAGRGGILNVSSLAGDQPLRGFATYGATKAFVTTFTESIAAELRGTGVHVTVVKPGYVFTEMTADSSPDRSSLLGRLWLEPAEVARAAIDAVERGRLTCVPGLHWRVAAEAVTALPRQLVRAATRHFDASS